MSERAKTSSSCVVPSTSNVAALAKGDSGLVPMTTPHKLCPLRICTCGDATIYPTKRLPRLSLPKPHMATMTFIVTMIAIAAGAPTKRALGHQ